MDTRASLPNLPTCSFFTMAFTPAEIAAIHANEPDWHINIRELSNVIRSVLSWGPRWYSPTSGEPVHVCYYIDNSSAVSWVNRRTAPAGKAQQLLRLLAFLESHFSLFISASHIPGDLNTLADAGSRLSSLTHRHVFTPILTSLSQVPLLPQWRQLPDLWDTLCAMLLSPKPPNLATSSHGVSGLLGVANFTDLDGSQDPHALRLLSWPSSQAMPSNTASTVAGEATLAIPSLPSSPAFSGITDNVV